jgi:hypothetical protein
LAKEYGSANRRHTGYEEGGRVMLRSSGDANRPFRVIDLVVGFASKSEGCGGVIDVEDVYERALDRLTEGAREMGANGLLFVNFQSRVASSQGCGGPQQVFEVFAWGTAVLWVKQ